MSQDIHPILRALVDIHPSWEPVFDLYLEAIEDKILQIGESKYYPLAKEVWNAFKMPYDSLRCVIIAQDPYHSTGIGGKPVAHGYAFSCRYPNPPQPSLRNIYGELSDSGYKIKDNGDISMYAQRGVLLLNTYVTVEPNKPGSHGFWQNIMSNIINSISNDHKNLVFMLWGAKAKALKTYIDAEKHLVLEAGHPSPLNSSRDQFRGCRHFLLCNKYLMERKMEPIDWNLS